MDYGMALEIKLVDVLFCSERDLAPVYLSCSSKKNIKRVDR